MFSRRQFLVTTATAVVATAGLFTWRFVRGSDEDAIVAVLRKRLDYLLMDERGLHAYSKDLAARRIVSSSRLRLLGVAGPLYTRLVTAQGNMLTRELQHGEERVVSLYLLSTDFFQNGADETKKVFYREFYDPINQALACTNPFARPMSA